MKNGRYMMGCDVLGAQAPAETAAEEKGDRRTLILGALLATGLMGLLVVYGPKAKKATNNRDRQMQSLFLPRWARK